jgi:hypothetical protein
MGGAGLERISEKMKRQMMKIQVLDENFTVSYGLRGLGFKTSYRLLIPIRNKEGKSQWCYSAGTHRNAVPVQNFFGERRSGSFWQNSN